MSDAIQLPTRDDMGRLAQQLGCLGYYGFGGGYWVGKQAHVPSGTENPCNDICPFSDGCWVMHKHRVEKQWPEVTAERRRLRNIGRTQTGITMGLRKKFGGDPLKLVVDANAEDGTRVATGGRPRERGHLGLTWPLRSIYDLLAQVVS